MKPTTNTWDKFYGNSTTSMKDFLGNFYSWELFDEILKWKPQTILEIGSGTGVMSIFLSHIGCTVVSIDNNKDVLKKARKNNEAYNGKASYKHADAFKIPYKDNTFDVVCSQGLLEHFDNPSIKKLLAEQLRVAKKSVVFSVPNKWYPVKDFGNERLLSSKEWLMMCTRMFPHKRIRVQEYQYMLRTKYPVRTAYYLFMNKKVQTMVTIKK